MRGGVREGDGLGGEGARAGGAGVKNSVVRTLRCMNGFVFAHAENRSTGVEEQEALQIFLPGGGRGQGHS